MASFAEMHARALARPVQSSTRNTPEINMDNVEGQPGDQGNDSFDDDNLGNDAHTAQHRNLTINEATQLIRRYNLPEGTIADVERFHQLHPSVQMTHVYLALQEIRSLMTMQSRPDEWWRITASFEKNVKTYTKALFLQPTIKNYDSLTIVSCMEKIIKRLRWGLPANAENNPVLWGSIVSLIQSRASDLRSDWKKSIMASITKRTPINELASTLTSSVDNFKPDGPFLVRIAVLRTVCTRDSSSSYWPLVATELENIQKSEQPRRILAEYYLEDQRMYPRPGVAALDADFTSTPSGNSIIQSAGQAISS
ncbi:hypothetical protein BDM02DRAFT_3121135 [Thelephora ganbajun]|uniref:Uncharacterized protein n=1 Tax=Thelephora ganbajun TaxID=370292 RepID=A0ACB6Z5J0_THEGA|nr:hypothetical protein BDM02DRAFT_3121135 [Thelephora ganbajun]